MSFSARAGELAGAAGALLGWTPDQFWAATPAELAAVFDFGAVRAAPADAEIIARLKEVFPDG
jgi:uncharacterized phage protein (TIGR02216 family)